MAAEAEVEEEAKVPGSRSQMAIHEAQVEWLEETYGVDLSTYSPADMIAIAYATRVAWRQTSEYEGAKASITTAREEAAAEKAAARERAAAEKAAAETNGKSEKPAKKAAAAKAPAKKAAASKGRKAKADPFA